MHIAPHAKIFVAGHRGMVGSAIARRLRAAVQALGNSIDVVASPEFAVTDPRWRDTLNAGAVQHFEFTLKLGWKMPRGQLERELLSPADLDSASYLDMLRLGRQRGLAIEARDHG